jgi:hypothetical protein
LQAIDKADGAVMRQLQALSEFADGDVVATGKAFDGEKGLMLLWREAGSIGGMLAEAQELTKGVAKCGEHFVVAPRDLAFHGHDSV